jgi:hypothetical protein
MSGFSTATCRIAPPQRLLEAFAPQRTTKGTRARARKSLIHRRGRTTPNDPHHGVL